MPSLEYKYRWITWKDANDAPPNGETSCLVYFNSGSWKDTEAMNPLTGKTEKVRIFDRTLRGFSERIYAFDGIVKKEELDAYMNKELDKMAKGLGLDAVDVQVMTKEPTITAK